MAEVNVTVTVNVGDMHAEATVNGNIITRPLEPVVREYIKRASIAAQEMMIPGGIVTPDNDDPDEPSDYDTEV